MRRQKGASNAISCLLIHTLLFSLSPLPVKAGEASRQSVLQAGRSPTASRAVESPLAGRGGHQGGVDGLREDLSSQLPASCSTRAMEGQQREAGGDAMVKVALGVGGPGELPVTRRWLPSCG